MASYVLAADEHYIASSKPLIVIITLQQDDLFRSVHTHLWDTLIQKANVRQATTADQARRALNSTVRPHAVIAADGFVTRHAYRDVVFQLTDYVRDGGTVLYAGSLSSLVGPLDISAHFETVWNLPWRFGEYYREDFTANPSNSAGLHPPEIVKTYSMKTILLDNVASGDAVYLDEGDINTLKTKRAPSVNFSAPAAFTRIGAGRFDFVGDVNGELGTTNLVIAMCLCPGSRPPASPGTGVPAPVSRHPHICTSNGFISSCNAQGSAGSMSSSPHTMPESQAKGAMTSSTETLPRVFILSLQNKRNLQEEYCQIFSALTRNASVTVINDANTAATTVSTPPRDGDVVLIADAGICEPAHTALLYKLILFAHEGATIVLGMDFCIELPRGDAHTFFGRWGLPWDFGEYHCTTFALNPAGVPKPLSARALQPSYSMKAVHLKGVPRSAAVYLPTADSRIESHVFPPTPITGAQVQETPAAFARVGKGFLGYVGDVNGEQGSARLTVEMCGIKIEPGDMGCRRYVSGTTFRGGKVVEEKITEEPEEPLPYALDTPSRAPVLIPKERDREAEVNARAEARASTKAEKDRKTEALAKEVGAAMGRQDGLSVCLPLLIRFCIGHGLHQKAKVDRGCREVPRCCLIRWPPPYSLVEPRLGIHQAETVNTCYQIDVTIPSDTYYDNARWAGADSAAGRALLYDPNNAKLFSRRGLARKGMSRFKAAEAGKLLEPSRFLCMIKYGFRRLQEGCVVEQHTHECAHRVEARPVSHRRPLSHGLAWG